MSLRCDHAFFLEKLAIIKCCLWLPESVARHFIKELGLPTTLKELGADKAQLKEIAGSCGISQGSYKPMTHEEILAIFQECYE